MSRIEYHVHEHLLKIATRDDIRTGSNPDAIVTAGVIKSAALLEIENIATADHAASAQQALKLASEAKNSAVRAEEALRNINENMVTKPFLDDTLHQTAVLKSEAGRLAAKDRIQIIDIDAPGVVSANTVLSGTGWIQIAGMGEIGELRQETVKNAAAIAEVKALAEQAKALAEDQAPAVDDALVQQLQKSVADTKVTVDNNTEAIEKLKTSTADNKSCCDELKALIEQGKQTSEQKEAVTAECCEELKATTQELKTKVETATETANTANNTIAQIRGIADAAKEKVEGLEVKVTALEAASPDPAKAQQALQALQDKITTAETAATTATENANTAKNRTDQFFGKVEQFEGELGKVTAKADKASADIAEVKATAEGAKATADEAKACCDDAKQKVQQVNTRVDDIQGKLDQIKAGASKADTTVDVIKQCCDDYKDKIDKNTAGVAENKVKLQQLETNLTAAQHKIDEASGKLTTAEEDIETAKNAAQDASRTASRLSNQQSALRNRVDNLDTEVNRAKANAQQALNAINNVKDCCDDVNDLKDKVTAAEAKVNKIDEFDGKINTLTGRVTEAEKAKAVADQAKATADEAKTLAEDSQTSVTEISRKVTALENRPAGVTSAQLRAIQATIGTIQEAASAAKKSVETNTTQLQTLDQKVRAQEPKIAALEEKVTAQEGNAPKIAALEQRIKAQEDKEPVAPPPPPPIPGAGESDWDKPLKFAGKGNAEVSDENTFAKALKKLHDTAPSILSVAKQDTQKLPGYDYDITGLNIPSTYATAPKHLLDAESWLKDPETVIAQVSHTAKIARDNAVYIQCIDDMLRSVNLTSLSKKNRFLAAHPTDRRKLVVLRGTVLSFLDTIGNPTKHIFLNTDREVSHGIGGAQHTFDPGQDYNVWAIVDWGRAPAPEVTFAMTPATSTDFPRGENASTALLIGGYHCLCADISTSVPAGHALYGFRPGDILPESVWCLTHRPLSSPHGMVYCVNGDFWIDIYLSSQDSGTKYLLSRYNYNIFNGTRNYFGNQYARILKRLPSDREFVAAVLGTPELSGYQSAGTTKAGGHTNKKRQRIVSYIGCEDGLGLMWQIIEGDLYVPASTGTEIRMKVAGSSHNSLDANVQVWSRYYGYSVNSSVNTVAGRGCSQPNRALSMFY